MAKPEQITNIDCNEEAASAINSVLLTRLSEMVTLRKQAVDESDPDGVHDMRVAARRLRSVLSDFTPYLRKSHMNSSLKKIKGIGDALGEVRDQDVAIKALNTLAKKAPAYVSKVLGEVVEERTKARAEALQELEEVLQKNSVHQLETEFASALTGALDVNRKNEARRSYDEVGKEIVRERLKDLGKVSSALYQPLEVEQLHELRIAFKRLRYALEVFEKCWGDPIMVFAGRVAEMQTALGELHDCDVWIESFGKLGIRARKNESAQSKAVLWLLRHFMELRTTHFRNACRLWRRAQDDQFEVQLINVTQAERSIELGNKIALT
jgi:CHAD domain-containing protein